MKLGYNEIMIASMYFNDINDFINLEIGIKRFQGNMERFHFNPIPLNEYSRKLFTNIETFHIYNYNDKTFNDGRIFKQVTWYLVDYSIYLFKKEKGNICKNIEYTKYDRKSYGNTIPSEVKSLGYECFKDCYELTTINIPTSIIKLGKYCFYKCSSLKSINIPSSVSKIEDYCFNDCYLLTSINIPSSVRKIGDDCFFECSSLTSMNIDCLQFVSKKRIFMNEAVLVSISIPENLEIINGKNIFKKDINEFIIPSSISKLGDLCFHKCWSLISINIPTTISKIGDYCFNGCTSLTSINIPTVTCKIGNRCFEGCSSLISIDIPSSISELGDKCFYECRSLTSINIPTPITKLGDCCLNNCYSLESINLSSSVIELGNYCFNGCTSLTSINIPSSITSFGYRCFYGCGCEEELKQNKRIPSYCFE
ncbi:hypothetical protein, conserved [Entamoeba dispar SAW760]|uniref:Leucine rich repeat containing protein BspA family protein n=1 Tax=Entamoeba dispar (strain ATCC PRA-260 / SAW760) TaxID=370354 RepID=B0EUE1_ENTDS|nr:uncharacterized protein EDI_050570 [Entamoeba dispar SAW760]EDR21847.1 hypothetical protein, conserved [Entamoeba dispar SAW760]|eukprot:EDR21847.1 hypothetical protein, conserved [Entamoeba dispar SAW760]